MAVSLPRFTVIQEKKPVNLIRAESNNKEILLWPARVDSSNSISLRNSGNDRRLTMAGFLNCLNAKASGTTTVEAVSERKVYNVVYRLEDSRIYNEAPYVAGTSTATNSSDAAALVNVSFEYEYDRSYTFSNTQSLPGTAVPTTIEATLPVIVRSGVVEIGSPINTAFEWNKPNTIPTSIQITLEVEVPPKSVLTVSYVGTKGTCDVPFSYTVQDTSSVDGNTTVYDETDGMYTGVNCYDFTLVVVGCFDTIRELTKENEDKWKLYISHKTL